ncbi:hypothetical protein N9140_00575 [bacterium]|nr:hypothetical protein [bacterium]
MAGMAFVMDSRDFSSKQGNIDGVTTVQINHGDLIKATWKHLRPHGRKTDVAPNFRLLPP